MFDLNLSLSGWIGCGWSDDVDVVCEYGGDWDGVLCEMMFE